jgi:hypothetical protein
MGNGGASERILLGLACGRLIGLRHLGADDRVCI